MGFKLSPEEFEKLSSLMRENYPKIEEARGQDLILFIGNSGSGKSTTVNYLLECEIVKDRRGKLVITDAKAPVGGGCLPITLFPGIYRHERTGMALGDFPGFDGVRYSAAEDIFESLSTQMAVKLARSIKGVFIVVDFRAFSLDRGRLFRGLIRTLSKLFENIQNIKDSVFFVMTNLGKEELENFDEVVDEKIKEALEALVQEQNNIAKQFSEVHTDDEREKLDQDGIDISKQIFLLNLMEEMRGNGHILPRDATDPLGREKFLKILHDCTEKDIPKTEFRYDLKRSEIRIKFDQFVLGKMDNALALFKQKQKLSEESHEMIIKISQLSCEIDQKARRYKELEEKCQRGSPTSGRENFIKGEITRLESELKTLNSVLKSKESRVEDLDCELREARDTRLITYYEDKHNKVTYKEVCTEVVVPVGKGWSVAGSLGAGLGLISRFLPLLGVIVAGEVITTVSIVTGGIGAFVCIVGAAGYIGYKCLHVSERHHFSYPLNLPFDRAIYSPVDKNKFQIITSDPQGGRFEASYQSSLKEDDGASLEIKGSHCDWPRNKEKISKLVEERATYFSDIDNFEEQRQRKEKELEDRKKEIEEELKREKTSEEIETQNRKEKAKIEQDIVALSKELEKAKDDYRRVQGANIQCIQAIYRDQKDWMLIYLLLKHEAIVYQFEELDVIRFISEFEQFFPSGRSDQRKRPAIFGQKIPDSFICPIGHQIMMTPVIFEGQTYEKTKIFNQLKRQNLQMTDEEIEKTFKFAPNESLEQQIKSFIEIHPLRESISEDNFPPNLSLPLHPCEELRPGDILLKYSDDSLTNKVIMIGTQVNRRIYKENLSNADITHAAIYLGHGKIVEASSAGLRIDSVNVRIFNWEVFRYDDTTIAEDALGIAASLAAESMQQIAPGQQHGQAGRYDLFSAMLAVFDKGDQRLSKDRMRECATYLNFSEKKFYCSHFVAYVYNLAAAIRELTIAQPVASPMDVDVDRILPANLLDYYLKHSDHWYHIGYLMPNMSGFYRLKDLFDPNPVILVASPQKTVRSGITHTFFGRRDIASANPAEGAKAAPEVDGNTQVEAVGPFSTRA